MNVKLMGHQTYVYGGIVYKKDVVVAVADSLGNELLMQEDDLKGLPVFVQTDDEAGSVSEDKPKVMRRVTIGGPKGSKVAEGGSGEGGEGTTSEEIGGVKGGKLTV